MKINQLGTLLALLTLTTSPLAQAKKIPIEFGSENLRPLGAGYNSRTEALLGKCVDLETVPAKPTPIELASGSFDLSMKNDQRNLADKLGISASGRYKTGVTTISASADFLNETASNEFNLSYTSVSEYQFKEVVDDSRANRISAMPGFENMLTNKDKFFRACGDEYVKARNHSARLFVNISMSFVSKKEKNRFAAEMGVSSPTLDLKAKFEKISSKFSSGNRMAVRAYQIGGDPSKMGKILCPTNSEGKPDPECQNSSEKVAECSFGNIGKCTSIIASAVAYSNAQDGDNFPNQVSSGNNYAVTALETIPYTTLGDPFPNPPSKEKELEFASATKQLEDLFGEQYKMWVYSNQLLNGQAPRLSEREKSEMEIRQNIHFKNMTAAADSIERCYDQGYAQCEKEIADITPKLYNEKNGKTQKEQYSQIQALTAPESFVQFCDVADDDHPSIRQTVETLEKFAITKVGSELAKFSEGDRCANLAQWFESQKELDLSGDYPLGDIAPIGTLKNLEKLILKNKNIKSIEALAGLTNLQELNLDGNKISDLSPLTEMVNLATLSIQDNRINQESMAKLGALNAPTGQLEKIDARGNQEDITCPLTRATGCKLQSFVDYANVSSASTKCANTFHHEAVALDDEYVLASGGSNFPDKSNSMQLVRNSDCKTLPQKMTVPRLGHTMTKTDFGILVIGGGTNQIELINPSLEFSSVLYPTPMPNNITDHTATLLPDGKVLVVGGATDADARTALSKPTGLTNDIYLVSSLGSETPLEFVGRLSVPRSGHTATLLKNGKVLILGGYSLNGMVNIGEIIDPVAKTVTVVNSAMPVGRVGHTATLLGNGHVFIAGGAKWSDDANRVLEPISEMIDFDPETNQFRVLDEKLSPARSKMKAIATSDNRVLLIGGVTGQTVLTDVNLNINMASNDIQIYDPKTEGLYSVATMLNHLVGFSASALGENKVLIFGGRPTLQKDANGNVVEEKMLTSAELLVYRPRN